MRHPVTGQTLTPEPGWSVYRKDSGKRDVVTMISPDGQTAKVFGVDGSESTLPASSLRMDDLVGVDPVTGVESSGPSTPSLSPRPERPTDMQAQANEGDIARTMSSMGMTRAEAIAYLKSSGQFTELSARRLSLAADRLTVALSRLT